MGRMQTFSERPEWVSRAVAQRLLRAKSLSAGNPKVLKLREADPFSAAGHQLCTDSSQHLHRNVEVLELLAVACQGFVVGDQIVFQVCHQPQRPFEIIDQLFV